MNSKSGGDGKSVSVIVPAYNAEEYIGKTISSLLGQEEVDLEVIVVDDCSADATLEIVNKYARKDSRIKIVGLKENKGAHLARMHGLKEAKGDYIGFVDADDYVDKRMYGRMLIKLEETHSCIAICSVKRVNEEGEFLKFEPKFRSDVVVEGKILDRFMSSKLGPAYLWNKLYRRELLIDFVDYGFPWRQTLNEDMLMNIGCFYKAKRICILEEAFCCYLKNPISVTRLGTKAEAYMEHVKAFAMALSLYGRKSKELELLIYRFYRDCISSKSLHVEDVKELDAFSEQMDAVLMHLEKVDRHALFKLSSRCGDNQGRKRGRFYRSFNKFVDRRVLKRNLFEFIK